jgi:YD repeat-containing protein
MWHKLMKSFTSALFASFLLASHALSGSAHYTYDTIDRLLKVERDDGKIIEYTYDSAGNRLTKDVTAGAAFPQAPVTALPPDAPGVTGPAPSSSSTPATSVGGNSVTHPDVRQSFAVSPEVAVSEVAGASPGMETGQVPAPPAPESPGLVAAAGKVVLLWHGGAAHETGFVVQRQEVPEQGAFEEIARPALPPGSGLRSVTWTDAQVKPGKSYTYRMAAYNGAGLSPFCPPLTVKVE